jgi:hypothetical protein
MTTAEKFELMLIPLLGIGIFQIGTRLPASIGAGALLLGASALLLLQSLMRDIWLLAKQQRAPLPITRRTARCMCVESTVGATGVTVGVMVLGTAIDRSVQMDNGYWSLLAVGVMLAGFAIKDTVFEWRPFRIRRDKDHVNIVFTWKG